MTDRPKTFGEMSPEEKGALLLASHEGKVIERYASGTWIYAAPPWREDVAYRKRPEPKREKVTLFGHRFPSGWSLHDTRAGCDTHMFVLYEDDGEPDCDSIRMERLE